MEFILIISAVIIGMCILWLWLGYQWGRSAGFNAAMERAGEASRRGFEAGLGAADLARRRQVIYGREASRN